MRILIQGVAVDSVSPGFFLLVIVKAGWTGWIDLTCWTAAEAALLDGLDLFFYCWA